MAIRDQLLRKQLLTKQTLNNQQEQSPAGDATTDIHATAKPYKRWMPGLRTLLRLRYLSFKKQALQDNKQALRYDVSADEIHSQVSQSVNGVTRKVSPWPTLLRPLVMVPLLIALLIAAIYAAMIYQRAEHNKQIFRLQIPKFSNTVYQYKAAQSTDKDSDRTQTLKIELQNIEDNILEQFSEHPSVQKALTPLLKAVQQKEAPPQDVFALVKKLNDALFLERIPYYLSPTVETADCSHLPLTAFLQRLFGGGTQGTGETCIVYVLLTFHVEEHRYYNAEQHNHLAFFTRRLDNFDIHDNVLGKVHLGDNTAQIMLSNIDATSANSTESVNDGRLQNKLMPEGMPDVYGLESIARRLQTRVIDSYTKELEHSWRYKLTQAINKLTRQESTVLPAATAKLQRRVADVTAFHEVQHLVDQFNDIQEPPWFAETLAKVATNVPMSPQFQSHVLWELSAFFTHIAHGEELNGILLNEFTGITLNPMLQDQPHYYSIRILLPILQAMHDGTLDTTPPTPALTLSDVARSYKYLSQQVEELDVVSRDAYLKLFNRELPTIAEQQVTSRVVETLEAQPQ